VKYPLGSGVVTKVSNVLSLRISKGLESNNKGKDSIVNKRAAQRIAIPL